MSDEATRKAAYRWCADVLEGALRTARAPNGHTPTEDELALLDEVGRIVGVMGVAGSVPPLAIAEEKLNPIIPLTPPHGTPSA